MEEMRRRERSPSLASCMRRVICRSIMQIVGPYPGVTSDMHSMLQVYGLFLRLW